MWKPGAVSAGLCPLGVVVPVSGKGRFGRNAALAVTPLGIDGGGGTGCVANGICCGVGAAAATLVAKVVVKVVCESAAVCW